MKQDFFYWECRPLTQEMVEYAAQDVCYLKALFSEQLKHCNEHLYTEILSEGAKYNIYSSVNLHIGSVESLNNGTLVRAFIKNFQKIGVFCALNLGYSGLVRHAESKAYIEAYYQIGDFMDLEVVDVNHKTCTVLLKMPDYPFVFP